MMGGGVQGFYGGFEYVAWETRRELLEEARNRRLAHLARPGRGWGERLAPALRFVGGALKAPGPRVVVEDREVAAGEVPELVYLTPGDADGAGRVVEVYLGGGGCVVRKTDLRTGASTDAFVADGPLRR